MDTVLEATDLTKQHIVLLAFRGLLRPGGARGRTDEGFDHVYAEVLRT